MNQKIAFFDFDGTITTHDSLMKFIRFAVGSRKFLIGCLILSPLLILYKLKFIPNDVAKQQMLSYFFKGWAESVFNKIATKYSLEEISHIVRPKAMQRIMWHKNEGHTVVVVSASLESWLAPWCQQNGMDVIATQFEILDGIVTGLFLSKNCYGAEKSIRIREKYNLNEFEYIYAYGDSSGDNEMLALADEKYYKPFC